MLQRKDQPMDKSPHPAGQLIGAWELVSGSYIDADQAALDYSQAGIQALKVLSESKFSFVTTARGVFYAAGSGDYTARDGLYTEIPALASHPEMVGKRYEFQYQLEGDRWENSRWENGVRVEHELWRRVR
jgi:hypothetical protein